MLSTKTDRLIANFLNILTASKQLCIIYQSTYVLSHSNYDNNDINTSFIYFVKIPANVYRLSAVLASAVHSIAGRRTYSVWWVARGRNLFCFVLQSHITIVVTITRTWSYAWKFQRPKANKRTISYLRSNTCEFQIRPRIWHTIYCT
jgi:hypothetical protein